MSIYEALIRLLGDREVADFQAPVSTLLGCYYKDCPCVTTDADPFGRGLRMLLSVVLCTHSRLERTDRLQLMQVADVPSKLRERAEAYLDSTDLVYIHDAAPSPSLPRETVVAITRHNYEVMMRGGGEYANNIVRHDLPEVAEAEPVAVENKTA